VRVRCRAACVRVACVCAALCACGVRVRGRWLPAVLYVVLNWSAFSRLFQCVGM